MGIVAGIDDDGLLEYSVVFTDRSLNSMSQQFQAVMRDISAGLKEAYQADAVALVPGGGTFAMEAVARQFGHDEDVLVIRNGWFSFRWSEIFEKTDIARNVQVQCAGPASSSDGHNQFTPFRPADIEAVCSQIEASKPGLVCAPHVETSAGMILPDDYIRAVADATHKAGGLFVLDCVASGVLFVDMKELGVDVLVTAPQKGWTSTPCSGVVMMSEAALSKLEGTNSSSYAVDLKKWFAIMQAYENGGHAYHATLPTDGLKQFRDTIDETREIGFQAVKQAQIELGRKMRELTESHGFQSVSADGFKAPTVIVNFTTDMDMKTGKKFAENGVQIAAGVPLEIGEPDDYMSFRIGLFGLDKLRDIEGTVNRFRTVLEQL